MAIIIVVNNPNDWPLNMPGVDVVSGRQYLTEACYSDMRGVKVFNLCKSYRYQSMGYYVSLLATARGHKPLPDVTTIQDMKSMSIVRFASEDLDDQIQKCLSPIHSEKFTLSIYFGRNTARRYDSLALQLFKQFQAPLLRAEFTHNHKWSLQTIGPIAASDIPADHWPFVVQVAAEYFTRRTTVPRRAPARFDLAVLHDASAEQKPSNEKAIARFIKAAESLDFDAEIIDKDDYGRIAEFDALFIRDTTAVNHYTYRFARRAAAEGMVVIDDPESILKCSNKVYFAELMDRHNVPVPRTVIVHRDNAEEAAEQLGMPCVLKQPDSSFSLGVVKVNSAREFMEQSGMMLEKSELIIAQAFVPTTFDWRVGVLDRHALYACKYHMADDHWQIINRDASGRRDYGRVETVPVEVVPRTVLRTAVRAANLMGDGLYGVDIKQSGKACYVIEVNDNPNIDAGFEDAVLRDELYERIMATILRRITRMKEGYA